MKNFIITNRPVITRRGKDVIDTSDSTITTQNLRFATLDMETLEVEVLPDVPTDDQGQYLTVDYSKYDNVDQLCGSEQWFNMIYQEMAGKEQRNDTLFFIHGFRCGFDCFIKIMQDLHRLYVEDGASQIQRIVGFTWPSNDKLTQYHRDQNDALMSGMALSRGYNKLIQFFKEFFIRPEEHPFCESDIHLLCHSMGNQVFESMFSHLKNDGATIVPVFKEVILAAPDIDYDVFEKEKPFHDIHRIAERVHVYFHRSDDALKISHLTKNRVNRLGLNGPRNIFDVPSNVQFVDASDVKDAPGTQERLIDHWYYKESPTIVRDMKQIFNGLPATLSEGRTYMAHRHMVQLK